MRQRAVASGNARANALPESAPAPQSIFDAVHPCRLCASDATNLSGGRMAVCQGTATHTPCGPLVRRWPAWEPHVHVHEWQCTCTLVYEALSGLQHRSNAELTPASAIQHGTVIDHPGRCSECLSTIHVLMPYVQYGTAAVTFAHLCLSALFEGTESCSSPPNNSASCSCLKATTPISHAHAFSAHMK